MDQDSIGGAVSTPAERWRDNTGARPVALHRHRDCPVDTQRLRAFQDVARVASEVARAPVRLAVGETVILLHPPLYL